MGGQKRPRARMRCAFFFSLFLFFMNGGPEKSLTRDCWGRLLLLQGPSFFYKEGWRLLFLFFFFFLFNEWRAAATAAAGSAAWVVPSSQPARGGKGHLHATAGLGRNRQCDLEGGGRCGLGILGLEQGGGGHTSISVSLVASGDGEGGARGPPTGNLLLFKISGAWGRRGQGPSSLICQKLRKCLLSISKKGRVGGC